jgi:hypothetical protein
MDNRHHLTGKTKVLGLTGNKGWVSPKGWSRGGKGVSKMVINEFRAEKVKSSHNFPNISITSDSTTCTVHYHVTQNQPLELAEFLHSDTQTQTLSYHFLHP